MFVAMTAMEWSKNTLLSFISDIESHPVLWNPLDVDYKKTNKKNETWIQLSEKYNVSDEELKRKWQSLQVLIRIS